jgi:hypothetical protein
MQVSVRSIYEILIILKKLATSSQRAATDKRCIKINGQDACKIAIQSNNVETDERGFIYVVDRANTGLHILEVTGPARAIAGLPEN